MSCKDPVGRGRWVLLGVVVLTVLAGCHGEQEWEPLTEQKIYVSDRFFDVAITGPKSAYVVGYRGKMIHTDDAGFSWSHVDLPTDRSLFSIGFADDGRNGWMVGEAGLILKTSDGGKTWTEQHAELWLDKECADPEERKFRTEDDPCSSGYLFALSVVDENTAHAIGDKSLYTRTTDGGKTWHTQTITIEGQDIDPDLALAFEDPVLYDIEFLDAKTGFIVGEFGKIYRTDDGGDNWREQQASVMDESVLDILDLPTFFDVEFSDRNNGIVAGLDGRIAVTTDGGNDWNFVANNVSDYIDPFYSVAVKPNGDRWVVGASGQVSFAPAGKPFVKGDLGSAVNNWLRRMRFYDDKVGWVVGGFGLIMYTDDGGETWFRRLG